MLLRDWVDVAWAKIQTAPGAMMNPFEYASAMYSSFWEGKVPEPKKGDAKTQAARAKASMGKPPSKSALDQLKALTERAAELRAAQDQAEE